MFDKFIELLLAKNSSSYLSKIGPLCRQQESLLYLHIYIYIKTHGSESRGQGGSTLRRPLDKRT